MQTTFTMRQLLEAGVHFGHHTRRWNPKMDQYIFGVRNNIHVLDLQQTVPMLYRALDAIREVTAKGGRVLMVGTKRQASEVIAETARKSGQYFVNHRWLGGMLTNWKTIANSIKRLKELEEKLSGETQGLTKKELLGLTRERDKLERALGGIKDMGDLPNIMFVIDTNKESLAIQEANKLGIPVVAVLDSNCDPDGIQFPIPGNDDAQRAIHLYCDLISRAILEGLQQEMTASGEDIGEQENPVEPALVEAKAEAEAPAEAEAEVAAAPAEEKAESEAEAPAAAKADEKKEAAAEKKPAKKAAAKKPAKKAEPKAAKKPAAKTEKKADKAKAEEAAPEAADDAAPEASA